MSGEFAYQLIVVAPPGRKRDHLVAMMDSIVKKAPTHCIDDFRQAFIDISSAGRYLILIDFRNEDVDTGREIATAFQGMENVRLVLLRSRFFKKVDMSGIDVIDLIYNDLSIDVMEALLHGNGID